MSVYQTLWRRWAPPWFQTAPNIGTFYESVGALLDSEAQRALDGRLAGIVYAGAEPFAAKLADGRRIECQPDALPWHEKDRGIKRYSTESDLSFRIRASNWRQLHAERGKPWGEIRHVRPYFSDRVAAGYAYPTIAIVSQTNDSPNSSWWYQVDPAEARTFIKVSPSNFSYDAFPSYRSRWWAFLDMTGTGYTPPETYDSGGVYDTSGWRYDEGGAYPFTTDRAADVAAMFNDWSAAHSWLVGVVLVWPMAGGAPFPTAAGVPTQDAAGWFSLPNGAGTWAGYTLPAPDGRASRPPNFQWIYDNPPVIV